MTKVREISQLGTILDVKIVNKTLYVQIKNEFEIFTKMYKFKYTKVAQEVKTRLLYLKDIK